jgi:GTP cyclohydrolase II
MFAYLDPSIREKLASSGQLVRIDARGKLLDSDAASEHPELAINVLGPIPLPIDLRDRKQTFNWFAFVRQTELAKANEIADAVCKRGDQSLFPMLASHLSVNSALVLGEPSGAKEPLVRVHSSCFTGDVLGSMRCECGPQLIAALRKITERESGGILVYMSGHEGRGIGLWAKAVTYLLQDAGQDTYQANLSLGLPVDSRDFGDAAAILLYLLGGDKPFALLTNNPKKIDDLAKAGLTKIRTQNLVVGLNEWNRRYLNAKRQWGHQLDLDDIDTDSTEKVQ